MDTEFIIFNQRNKFSHAKEYVIQNCLQLVTVLLDHGLNVNQIDQYNKSLVYHALDKNQLQMFDLLVHRGADLRRPEDYLLHVACSNGYYSVVEQLLKIIDPNILAQRFSDLEMPLHTTVATNHIDIVRLLLSHGANPNGPTMVGYDFRQLQADKTPLFYVNDPEIAKLLLEHGADPHIKNLAGEYCIFHMVGDSLKIFLNDPILLNSKNKEGETLLHQAIGFRNYYYNIDHITMLVNAGIDLSLKDKNGYTPKEFAIDRGFGDVVDVIQQYEEMPDIKEPE